jgi:hypothetical protein
MIAVINAAGRAAICAPFLRLAYAAAYAIQRKLLIRLYWQRFNKPPQQSGREKGGRLFLPDMSAGRARAAEHFSAFDPPYTPLLIFFRKTHPHHPHSDNFPICRFS